MRLAILLLGMAVVGACSPPIPSKGKTQLGAESASASAEKVALVRTLSQGCITGEPVTRYVDLPPEISDQVPSSYRSGGDDAKYGGLAVFEHGWAWGEVWIIETSTIQNGAPAYQTHILRYAGTPAWTAELWRGQDGPEAHGCDEVRALLKAADFKPETDHPSIAEINAGSAVPK